MTEGLREGCERWKRSQWGGGVGMGAGGEERGINLYHLKLLMGVGREDHGHNPEGLMVGLCHSMITGLRKQLMVDCPESYERANGAGLQGVATGLCEEAL